MAGPRKQPRCETAALARCRDARRAIRIAHVVQESRGYGRGNPFARPRHRRIHGCVFGDRCADPPTLARARSKNTGLLDLSSQSSRRTGGRLLQLSAVRAASRCVAREDWVVRHELAASARRGTGKFDGEDPGAIRVRRRPRHSRGQAGARTVAHTGGRPVSGREPRGSREL